MRDNNSKNPAVKNSPSLSALFAGTAQKERKFRRAAAREQSARERQALAAKRAAEKAAAEKSLHDAAFAKKVCADFAAVKKICDTAFGGKTIRVTLFENGITLQPQNLPHSAEIPSTGTACDYAIRFSVKDGKVLKESSGMNVDPQYRNRPLERSYNQMLAELTTIVATYADDNGLKKLAAVDHISAMKRTVRKQGPR